MPEQDIVLGALVRARAAFAANVAGLTVAEALFAAEGYRSVLGVMKHIGGWAHVYSSFAFDGEPVHWARTAWPRGLRATIEASQEYVDEVAAWTEEGMARWVRAVDAGGDEQLWRPARVHFGGEQPLANVAMLVAEHVTLHTGEINMLLSIARGEAWEYTEEVEENHISTFEHAVRPGWMSSEQAAAYRAAWRERLDR
jgi:hypothetical protein